MFLSPSIVLQKVIAMSKLRLKTSKEEYWGRSIVKKLKTVTCFVYLPRVRDRQRLIALTGQKCQPVLFMYFLHVYRQLASSTHKLEVLDSFALAKWLKHLPKHRLHLRVQTLTKLTQSINLLCSKCVLSSTRCRCWAGRTLFLRVWSNTVAPNWIFHKSFQLQISPSLPAY